MVVGYFTVVVFVYTTGAALALMALGSLSLLGVIDANPSTFHSLFLTLIFGVLMIVLIDDLDDDASGN